MENLYSNYGINPQAILNFYRKFEEIGGRNYSLLIYKDNKCVYEKYCYPYNKDSVYNMFSFTKSVLSTAVGFAIAEGKLTLDTKIYPYFKHFPHIWCKEIEEITLKDLLTMRSNKKFNFLQDMTANYCETFMKSEFRKPDERGFWYSNNDAHMVAFLLQKVLGMTIEEYLEPRLFTPLDIKLTYWEKSYGVNVGGAGLLLSSHDMAKICLCYINDGMYDGKQVIPKEWVEQVFIKHIDFPPRTYLKQPGYSYYFWLKDEVLQAEGLFGQMGLMLKEKNTVVIINGVYVDDNVIDKIIHTILLPPLFDKPAKEGVEEEIEAFLADRDKNNQPIVRSRNYPKEKEITNNTYKSIPCLGSITRLFTKFTNGLIANTVCSSYANRPKKNPDNFHFEFGENSVKVRWFEDNDMIEFESALDGNIVVSDIKLQGYVYKIWSYAYWNDDKLVLVAKPFNSISTKQFTFSFGTVGMSYVAFGVPNFIDFCVANVVSGGVIKEDSKIKNLVINGLRFLLSITKIPLRYIKK